MAKKERPKTPVKEFKHVWRHGGANTKVRNSSVKSKNIERQSTPEKKIRK
jgi:hypothetical protein